MSFIHPIFEKAIGQEHAKLLFSQSLQSLEKGGETIWPLVTQQAGGGKSFLCRLFCDAAKQMGAHVLIINSPEEFRADGESWEALTQALVIANSGERVVIFIDEYHLIKNRATVRMEAFHSLLMKCADKGNKNKQIPWQGETINLHRGNITFLLATNFPAELDKSGAFQSRFDHVALSDYTESELVEILQGMLTNEGFREVNEKTLTMIARCGRGTARPMEKIVDRLKIAHSASGKATKTINREDVISALKISKMYPRGLKDWEVRLLNDCVSSPRIDQVIVASMPQVELKALRSGKGFLIEQKLGAQTRGGFQTTTVGSEYLKAIKAEGFSI